MTPPISAVKVVTFVVPTKPIIIFALGYLAGKAVADRRWRKKLEEAGQSFRTSYDHFTHPAS